MWKKIKFETILLVLLLLLGMVSIVQPEKQRYEEIVRRIPKISFVELKEKTSGSVLIGSGNCEDCIRSINQMMVDLYREKGESFYLDAGSLEEFEVESLKKDYGIAEIPAFLFFREGSVELIGPKEILEGNV